MTKIKKRKKIDARTLTLFVIAFAAIGGYIIFKSFAAGLDLEGYYPDQNRYRKGYYLNGYNYANSESPSSSVLWFQSLGNGAFRQYNWGPYNKCHWDQLAWTTAGLSYTETNDQCGSDNNQIVYSPGIVYMPQTWSQTNWTTSGTSKASYYDNGKLACRGTNKWNSAILGWEPMTPSLQGIHIQNNQHIYWTWGSDPSGCAAGYTTNWQENFYLVNNLPIQGLSTTATALKRIVGGNLDNFNKTGHWDYDVWFDDWQKLPPQ